MDEITVSHFTNLLPSETKLVLHKSILRQLNLEPYEQDPLLIDCELEDQLTSSPSVDVFLNAIFLDYHLPC